MEELRHPRKVEVLYRGAAVAISVGGVQEEINLAFAAVAKGLGVEQNVLPKVSLEDLVIALLQAAARG
eukprot:7474527-Lingulodinium_polyedra.AAC.1